ncbi:hypothetical protein P691DRAFT_813424 [Macrolepiota fuliginosa MF-IS2]|uniref:Uncharacterized protein n=1 Tax=Macrolepiota fuliginosa MF-IS2 TaxID=1400762 RepID=A0A9P5X1K8_9AGAR|nr:hypothetical protein P691DRAFT_813424 [Macrolepiota fuliginosa MF-IS2]
MLSLAAGKVTQPSTSRTTSDLPPAAPISYSPQRDSVEPYTMMLLMSILATTGYSDVLCGYLLFLSSMAQVSSNPSQLTANIPTSLY